MIWKLLAVILYGLTIFTWNNYTIALSSATQLELIKLGSGSYFYLPFPAIRFSYLQYTVLPLGIAVCLFELLIFVLLVFKFKVSSFATLLLFATTNFTLIFAFHYAESKHVIEEILPILFYYAISF